MIFLQTPPEVQNTNILSRQLQYRRQPLPSLYYSFSVPFFCMDPWAFKPIFEGHSASRMQENQCGCLRPALCMLQTLLWEKIMPSSGSLGYYIAWFPWKLLPASGFKSASYICHGHVSSLKSSRLKLTQ